MLFPVRRLRLFWGGIARPTRFFFSSLLLEVQAYQGKFVRSGSQIISKVSSQEYFMHAVKVRSIDSVPTLP